MTANGNEIECYRCKRAFPPERLRRLRPVFREPAKVLLGLLFSREFNKELGNLYCTRCHRVQHAACLLVIVMMTMIVTGMVLEVFDG